MLVKEACRGRAVGGRKMRGNVDAHCALLESLSRAEVSVGRAQSRGDAPFGPWLRPPRSSALLQWVHAPFTAIVYRVIGNPELRSNVAPASMPALAMAAAVLSFGYCA